MTARLREDMALLDDIATARERESRGRDRAFAYLSLAALLLGAAFVLAALAFGRQEASWLRMAPTYAGAALALMGLVIGYYFGAREAPDPVGADTIRSAIRLHRLALEMQSAAAEEHASYLRRRRDAEAQADLGQEP